MIEISYSMFFDRPGVMKSVKDGTKSGLAKAGAFVRTRARTSIRKRKKSSAPGSPPSSHVGTLRDLIFFGYDTSSESMIVGPKKFGRSNPTGAQILENGGVGQTTKGPKTFAAFPYMKPALDAEAPKFPDYFANCVKG